MHRRWFVPLSLLTALLGCLVGVTGCGGGERRETGTTVEMTPEDIQGFEAAEESYKAMEKGGQY